MELINRAIKLSSSNLPGLYLTKGEISFKLDEYGDAVMAYDKVLAVDKTNMQALDGVANSLLYLVSPSSSFMNQIFAKLSGCRAKSKTR